jgi:hypothetical protein
MTKFVVANEIAAERVQIQRVALIPLADNSSGLKIGHIFPPTDISCGLEKAILCGK